MMKMWIIFSIVICLVSYNIGIWLHVSLSKSILVESKVGLLFMYYERPDLHDHMVAYLFNEIKEDAKSDEKLKKNINEINFLIENYDIELSD